MAEKKYQGFSFLMYQNPAVRDRIGLARFIAATLRGCYPEKILLNSAAVKASRYIYMVKF